MCCCPINSSFKELQEDDILLIVWLSGDGVKNPYPLYMFRVRFGDNVDAVGGIDGRWSGGVAEGIRMERRGSIRA